MRNHLKWAGAFVLGLGLGVTVALSGARAEADKIPPSKLPKVVVAAVEARFPGAVIKDAEKETEEGKTFFELVITHDGQKLEVSVMDGGKIVAVEKEIKVADLPAAVSRSVKARYPKAPIKKAEEMDENGTISYEVVVEKAPGKLVELVVDKDGKILDEDAVDKD